MDLNQLISSKDFEGIKKALLSNPALANGGLPYNRENTQMAHPLHRLCDRVHANHLGEEEALAIAGLLLDNGSNVNGGEIQEYRDTPLIAAASLGTDRLGILFIEQGADIHHAGCHGGTALHWASWCGRPILVQRLVQEGAEVNKLCLDFRSTPLFWAIHGYRSNSRINPDAYLECTRLLLRAGSDKSIPNIDGLTILNLLESGDELFRKAIEEK